jgi:hypothetical protein
LIRSGALVSAMGLLSLPAVQRTEPTRLRGKCKFKAALSDG